MLRRRARTLSSCTPVILVLATICPPPALATQYRVSLSGSDANDGINAPWRSLDKGIGALDAGDALIVEAGQYSIDAALLIHNKQGTQAAPITIEAQGTVVLLDGADRVNVWQGILDVRGSSWLTIRGFSLEQSGFFGVYIENSDHITVEGCKTNESLASGVASWTSSEITIRDNDIRAACNQGAQIKGSTCQEHISLDHVQGFLIEGNKVHDSTQSGNAQWGGGEGIDCKNGSSNGIVRNNEVWNLVQLGIYVDAWEADIHTIEIYGNSVHHNANGIVITSEQTGSLYGISVHDNLVYDNGFDGIAVHHYQVSNPTLSDIQVYNNTVVGNGLPSSKPYFLPPDQRGPWGTGIVVRDPDVSGLVVRDNLIYDNVTAQLELVAGLASPVIEHNLLGPTLGSGSAGQNAVQTSDPMFVDLAGRDLRLLAGSPAIDAGLGGANLGATDYFGNARVVGSAVDIGAFEFGSAPPGGSDGSIQDGGASAGDDATPGGDWNPGIDGGDKSGMDGGGVTTEAGSNPRADAEPTDGCSCATRSKGSSTAWSWMVFFVLIIGRRWWRSARFRRP